MKTINKSEKILLVIESESKSNNLWGRIEYKDDLIVEVAKDIDELTSKMESYFLKNYKLSKNEFEFDLFFDLTALFKEKNFLNLSAIAERAGINRSIMAQYVAGIKFPSLERAGKIQEVIHGIGNELRSVNLAVKMKPVNSGFDVQFFEDDINEKEHLFKILDQSGVPREIIVKYLDREVLAGEDYQPGKQVAGRLSKSVVVKSIKLHKGKDTGVVKSTKSFKRGQVTK